MAKIVEVTNPVTGQPTQVDQLDHTAQQIDDAVGRALPGGYYDKWVSQLPGQNLLDNSVFVYGCLVDQRGGYVVPPGVGYYSDLAGTTRVGTTDAYYNVDRSSGHDMIKVNGTDYFIDIRNAVRGYTGSGYGPDRWIGNGCVSLITDNGIKLIFAAGSQYRQILNNYDLLDGMYVTVSALFADGTLACGTMKYDNSSSDWDTHTLIETKGVRFILEKAQGFTMFSDSENQIELKAAFLDPGDHQKHFYQDENGVWQLNALPNYADTLARCQRYQVLYGNLKSDEAFAPLGTGYSYNSNTIFVVLDLPQELCKSATKEVEIIGSLANFGLYYNQAEYVVPSAVSIDQVGTRYIGLKFTVPSTPASSYVLKPRTPGTGLLIKANL